MSTNHCLDKMFFVCLDKSNENRYNSRVETKVSEVIRCKIIWLYIAVDSTE